MSRSLVALILLAASPLAVAFTPELVSLERVPVLQLPVAELRAQIERDKHEPLRFATATALALDPRNGDWDEPEPGIARWRLRLRSDDAQSLHLHLEQLKLPAAAQLWFYGSDGADLQGPLTANDDGSLWSPLVRAEEAVLEARMPAPMRDAFNFKLVEAYHGFRAFDGVQAKGAFGASQSCNIDVACSAGNAWRNEIRSVVYLQIAGFACSGTLVNNTRQDNRLLILTANHCGVSALNVGSVRAYFGMEKDRCGSTSNGPTRYNLSGRRLLARDAGTDFALLELNGTLSGYSPYYAGWDARSGVAPSSGVGIHHPQGDDKKISVYSSAPGRVEDQLIGNALSGFRVDAWRVVWSAGTTEGGSSGSGLWNQNGRVVGILSGGSASCSGSGDPDYYARLDRAWQANAASDGQLKAHLDPNDSGCQTLAGKPSNGAAGNACTVSGNAVADDAPRDGGRFGGSASLTLLLLAGLAGLRRQRRSP
jgi:lysyl endopeptidase